MSGPFTFQHGGIGRQIKGVKALRKFAVPVIFVRKLEEK
jgi:hypothetical protein